MTAGNDIAESIDQASDGEDPPDDRVLADLPRNDYGNAKRLIARYGQDLLAVDGSGWHVWDGRRFEVPFDKGAPEAIKKAHATATAIVNEAHALADDLLPDLERAVKESDESEKKEAAQELARAKQRVADHRKFATAAGNGGKIAAMLDQAAPYLRRRPAELDADPWALNLPNGTLDLRKMELRAHHRGDLITKIGGAVFDADADCPKFRAFLEQCHPGEDLAELRTFLQVSMGYAACGDISEQMMWLHHGRGSNGKSVFFNVISAVLGGDGKLSSSGYAASVPIETFVGDDNKQRSGGEATPELIDLQGARLAVASEPEKGKRLAESLVKRITGGERMKVRRLFEGMFDFAPSFKLHISANDRPRIRGQDYGIWRRVKLVPWSVKFEGKRLRKFEVLVAELLAERSGILNWLLDGLRIYLDKGLKIPAVVSKATDSYKADEDPIGEFVSDRCDTGDNFSEKATPLWQAYLAWCDDSGQTAMKSQTSFGRALADAGFMSAKVSGVGYRQGLALKSDAPLKVTGAPAPGEGLV